MYFSIPSVKITTMKYLYGWLLVGWLACLSCTQPKTLVYKNLNHFGIGQAGFKNTVITMDLVMYNPNKYSLKLKNTDVDVYINEHHVGKALIRKKFTIPAADTFSLPILLRVDLVQAIPNAIQLLISKEITLKLSGIIRAGKHGMFIKIPITYEGKQKIR
jgi:LEA14-like dessication related protein